MFVISTDSAATHGYLGIPDQDSQVNAGVQLVVHDMTLTVAQIQTCITKLNAVIGTMGLAGATVAQYHKQHSGQTS